MSIDYTEDEKSVIDSFNKVDSNYWNSDLEPLKTIRSKIKEYYLAVLGNKCCYCQMLKQENHGSTWDVEHILPKALYPQYMFELKNLSVSCKECNQAKLDKEICIKSIKAYPRTGNNIKIVHPNFDVYQDHIKVVMAPDGKIFHTPLNGSKKARETIVACNLFRFQEEAFGKENSYKKSVSDKLAEVFVSMNLENLTEDQRKIAIQTAIECIF